ncbi:taspase, threonine aspartase, 1 [Chytriomyces hyalinus]|nr:taspase, threonine aspartase, 1 [Chytriomyces hyalinus]
MKHAGCLGFTPLVAVHTGAGSFSSSREKEQCKVVAAACRKGLAVLSQRGSSSADAATETVRYLEESALVNAGFGSNLTTAATVECDAALMDGTTGVFTGVGAVAGVRSAIACSKVMMDSFSNDKTVSGFSTTLGRVKPMFLVSEGAARFATDRDSSLAIDPDALVCDRALNAWESIAKALQNPECVSEKKHDSLDQALEDTVGAVVLDCCGNIASAVSSGGILFKYPGRIGEAAMYACGIWAQSVSDPSLHHHQHRSYQATSNMPKTSNDGVNVGVGCSLSGTGEQIMRTLLGREIASVLLETHQHHDTTNTVDTLNVAAALQRVFQNAFLGGPLLSIYDDGPKNAGVLLIRATTCMSNADPNEPTGSANFVPERTLDREIWVAHTTEAMCVGWMSMGDEAPVTMVSRKNADATTTGSKRKRRKQWQNNLSSSADIRPIRIFGEFLGQ